MNFFLLQVMVAMLFLVQSVVARCPNWCNKRGECTSPQEGGYCVCHYGFTGEDCSQRLCPAGFDPVNLDNIPARRTIRLETGHMGGVMVGKYAFGFAGSEVYMPANSNDNDETKCQMTLSKLNSIKDISCKRETFNSITGTASYLISMLTYPQRPYMNNLIHHNGNPGINMFSCNVSKIDHEEASEPFCFVSSADTTTQLPLYAECGNHGTCDRVKGVCACNAGFKGEACLDNSDNEDIYDHTHEGPYFTATLVKLNLDTTPTIASSKFNLFQATLNTHNVTTIRGDSVFVHSGDVVVGGGISIGMDVSNTSSVGIGSAKITSSVLDSSDHLALYTNNTLIHAITNTGDVSITGTLDVLNTTLVVQPRLVTAQNLKLLNDLYVAGSATVEDSLMIGSGFALNKEGITVDVATHTGKLFELKSREKHFNGTLFELNSLGEHNALIKTVTNGLTTFELHSSGYVSMNGLRLISGGVEVLSGGVEVSAGGLSVHGGLTVHSGGLTLDNQPYSVGTLHTTNIDTNLHGPIISATTSGGGRTTGDSSSGSTSVSGVHYAGSMLELTSTGDSDIMNFINLLHTTPTTDTTTTTIDTTDTNNTNTTTTNTSNSTSSVDTSVFKVRGSGLIDSTSGAVFRGTSGVDVYGSMLLRGKVALQRVILTPVSNSGKYSVVVPLNATYVVIEPATYTTTSTGTTTTTSTTTNSGTSTTRNSVEVHFTPSPSTHSSGRIVILTNTDNYTTSGVVQVPPHTTVMLVYDGVQWVSVDALKAPMHVLENVRTLSAANDLDLGPHTLTAQRFLSTSLHSSSVVYSSNGVMSSSDKFTYNKGVLAVPAVRVENLLCNLDARGNDISNAILSNAKLTAASVSATDVTVPGLAGLAYFTAKGALQASTTLTLDPEGRLLVADLYTTLNSHGHSIHNTTIHTANLTNIGYVKATDVYVSSVVNSVLVSNGEGKIGSTSSIVIDNDIVGVKSLKVDNIVSSVDMNSNTLHNVHINGGSVSTTSVNTNTLHIQSLSGSSNRLVYADTSGVIHTHDTTHPIHISTLSVDDIVYSSSVIDFHGRTVKNIVLDTDTFMLGPQKSLTTDNLVITSTISSGSSSTSGVGGTSVGDRSSVLVSTSDGSVVGSSMHYTNNILDVSSVHTHNIVTDTITISSASTGGVLSTTSNGTVYSTSSVQVEAVGVGKTLTVNPSATLILAGIEPGTLLTLNSKHELTTVPSTYAKNTNTVSAYMNNVHTEVLHSAAFSTDKAIVKELVITSGSSGTSDVVSGTVLVQSKDGKVGALSEEVLYADKGVLHLASVLPVKGQSSVTIGSALLLHSNLSSSHIHNAHSVETNKLIVKDVAEFYTDVVIDGSVTVHGTVIGSGPYVDSSDKRLKSNITTLTNTLHTVNQLRSVSYNYRAAEYPARGLPTTPQIGFIAQELEAIQPELVYTDSEGYKSIAYSHVTVLLASAVQELQTKHEAEMVVVRNEIKELRRMVELLMKK